LFFLFIFIFLFYLFYFIYFYRQPKQTRLYKRGEETGSGMKTEEYVHGRKKGDRFFWSRKESGDRKKTQSEAQNRGTGIFFRK